MMLWLALSLCLPALVLSQPRSGPCVLGTHSRSRSMNCTEQGYFELTQCFERSCVCVNPLTGHEADGTKTFSNRILPRCGACFTKVAKELANGKTDNLPLCENEYGRYQAKQCTGNRCTCVNPDDGTFMKSGGPNLVCDAAKSTLDSTPTQSSTNSGHIPVAKPQCALVKDRGHRCSNGEAKTMFYYDTSVYQCLAFKYDGCGGNGNRFATINECWSSCIFADFGGCARMKPPLKDTNGESVMCSRDNNDGLSDCPAGYKCTHLPFFSICCEKSNEDLFRRNLVPKCGPQQLPPVNLTAGGVTVNLLGKSCADDFCPPGATCNQLEILAHCC